MHRTHKSFIPLAYDVFGGAAPKAEDFLKQMASLVVQKNLGIADGKEFDMAYVTLMGKWRTRLSLTIHREVAANCIIVGARNARGGERLGTGVLSDGTFHLIDSNIGKELLKGVCPTTRNLREIGNILSVCV